jgi:hypothetical protein
MDAEFEALRQAQLSGVIAVIDQLETADTSAGASLILGMARGRLDVLHNLGIVADDEYTELRAAFRQQFKERWPYLFDDEPPRAN